MQTAHLPQGLWGGRVYEFAILPSTNQWALAHGAQYSHGDVLWARQQASGHGRFDRPWLSHGESGLTFSVVLDPDFFPAPAANLGQVTALALRQTLLAIGIHALVKWPNDVLVNDRKIAGILLESEPGSQKLILGIGVNVNQAAALLQDVDQPATSTRIELNRVLPPGDVLACLLRQLQAHLDTYRNTGLESTLAQWRQCDALVGQWIEVHTPDCAAVRGLYAGLDADGRLMLTAANGQCHAFWSGDVVRIRARTYTTP